MLTDITIKKLPPPPKRREIPDGKAQGLYLVVQPSGAKSWALRYRFNGIPKKLTLGPYRVLDLASARRRATQALGRVAGGEDPAAKRAADRRAALAERNAQADLVERVAAQFVERHAKPNTRDWQKTERMLMAEVVDRWRGKRLSQVSRAHVHEMLDGIADRAPVRANRVFGQFRKMCSWAVSRGVIERSPCEGVSAPTKETRRDRVLSDDEVRLAWRAFDRVGWPFGPIGKLLLLTGARRDEVAGMRWGELDLPHKTWTLPKERTKNNHETSVPLSDAAAQIIAGLPRIEGKDGYVFTTTGKSAVSGFSRAKRAIDIVMRDAAQPNHENGEPPHWTLHDLRRTVATNLQKLGVRLEVTEAVLNHVSGSRAGIVGVYQRHTWAEEKKAALDLWSRRLDAILGGDPASTNVIDIAKARA
jgi:integrase